MHKIALVNMPFAGLGSPSIALTQLKSVLDSRYCGEVSVEVLYLNQDFAHYMGVEFYRHITGSMTHHTSGLGDWFFRQAAFPDQPDNSEDYFQRFYSIRNEVTDKFKQAIRAKRRGLPALLDELIEKYGLDRADLIGFTSMFSQTVASAALARRLKQRNADIVTVIGGANCEAPMGAEIARNIKQIDFVFSGPALRSFPEFVGYRLQDQIDRCHGIKGVLSKRNAGLLQSGCNGNSVGEELDINTEIGLDYEPFLDTLEKNFPNGKVDPVLFFETSRGCWWGEKAHCTFCGLNGSSMGYRAMAPEKALDQFRSLFKYSSRCSRYESVDNILPRNYLKEVLPALTTPPNVELFYEVKADLVESDFKVLSDARVKSIQPGIEALATSTLKLMRKGTSVFQNLMLLKNCAHYGIRPAWNLLLGFPGEDEGVYKKYLFDLPLLVHLPPPSGAFPVRFDRYSPYYIEAEKYGLDLKPFDFYELTYPFSKESLANMAYYFSDQNFAASYFTTMMKYLPAIKQEANQWQSRWRPNSRAALPQLFFTEDGESTVVYDSRSGDAVEHQVGLIGKRILEHLSRPARLSDLPASLLDIPDFDPAQEIAALQRRGLIFQEGDRFLSLVFAKESSVSLTA